MTKGMWWIVAAVVVAAGLIWYFTMGPTKSVPAAGQETATTLPTGTATSNAALNTDLSAIDGQMSGFSSDNANVNSSMSDQQVQQSSL